MIPCQLPGEDQHRQLRRREPAARRLRRRPGDGHGPGAPARERGVRPPHPPRGAEGHLDRTVDPMRRAMSTRTRLAFLLPALLVAPTLLAVEAGSPSAG